jgi:hypothetical protein
VQQSAALRGWSARLAREAASSMNDDRRFHYPLRLLRIRPTSGQTYAFDWWTPPWMAPGAYDLEMMGPGFSKHRACAVHVADPLASEFLSELLIPAQVEAAELESAGVPLLPRSVTWAGVPSEKGQGSRLMRFASSAQSHPVTWKESAASAPCRLRIHWPLASDVPFDVRDEIRAVEPSAVNVAFDLAKARWAQGDKVRALWLVSDSPLVEVWTLDNRAAGCAAGRVGRFHRSRKRATCQYTPAVQPFPLLLCLLSSLSF